MKKLKNLNGVKMIRKNDQKSINGGRHSLIRLCAGTGTGGGSAEGHSEACIGFPAGTNCTINGYQAECSGGGTGFWYL